MRDHIGDAQDYQRPDAKELRELGRRHRSRPPLAEPSDLTALEGRVLLAATNMLGRIAQPGERAAVGRLLAAGWVERRKDKKAVFATEAGRKALRAPRLLTEEIDDVPRLKQRDGITTSGSLAVRGADGDEVIEAPEDTLRRSEEERLMALEARDAAKLASRRARRAA